MGRHIFSSAGDLLFWPTRDVNPDIEHLAALNWIFSDKMLDGSGMDIGVGMLVDKDGNQAGLADNDYNYCCSERAAGRATTFIDEQWYDVVQGKWHDGSDSPISFVSGPMVIWTDFSDDVNGE